MDTTKIIADLRAERNRIDQAVSALESLTGISAKGGSSFEFGANKPTRGRRRTMCSRQETYLGSS